jgi:hypothetical protein
MTARGADALQLEAIMLRQGVEAQRWLMNESTTADVIDSLADIASDPACRLPVADAVRSIERNTAAVLILEACDRTSIGAIGLVTKAQINGVNVVRCDLEMRAPVDHSIAEILATKLEETAMHEGGIGRCSAIRISADGSFPCPRGYEFEGRGSDFRTMARQVGAAQLN